MARYLTPSRVSLLSLVAIYTESRVPTAATIPILSFVIDQLIPLDQPSNLRVSAGNRSFLLSIEDLQRVTITQASAIPGRTVWDLLLKALWEINSFDTLDAFLTEMSGLLAKTPEEKQRDAELGIPPEGRMIISRTSPLGTFIRRAQLEYTRLQFHDAVALWESFVAYREPTLSMWKKRNPMAGATTFDVNIESVGLTWDDPLTTIAYAGLLEADASVRGVVSTEDVERLLEFQVEEMQKTGIRATAEMKAQFRKMLEGNVTVPSLSHYTRFLDSWRSGDYPSSFDNLHRYFDYTMHNRDRTFYQYALLNLAILQADFGCFDEAVAAMQEAIATARENKDMACLNFSLSWLYHFGKAHPKLARGQGKRSIIGVEKEGLAFLKSKAKDAGMWTLLSTCLLSEAKMGISNGESLSHAFENITRSAHLNVVKHALSPIASQMLLQSSLWGRLGVTQLSWSYCEMFLQCFAQQAPYDDMLRCICRSAYILAQRGRYDDAFARMDEADGEWLRTLRMYQYWVTYCGLMQLSRAVHRNELDAAERLLAQLQSPEPSEPEILFEIQVLQIDLYTRRGDLTRALETLEALVETLKDESADLYLRVFLLTTKALLLDKCGRPQKGFSVAVRAASLAWRSRMMPALWHALGAIANILVHLGEFDAATQVLGAIMPQVIETEDAMLTAQTYGFLADGYMGLAGECEADSAGRKEYLTKALESINGSFADYSRAEDRRGQCEMMSKKATVMHLLGELALANDCAAKYLDLRAMAD